MISKDLLNDSVFLNEVENIYSVSKEEIEAGEAEDDQLNISEYWEIAKKTVRNLEEFVRNWKLLSIGLFSFRVFRIFQTKFSGSWA